MRILMRSRAVLPACFFQFATAGGRPRALFFGFAP